MKKKLKIFEAKEQSDVVEVLTEIFEEEVEKKIHTMRILGEEDEWLEVIVIFEDKSVLLGKIHVLTFFGNMACRIQAAFI